jgi:hypothetical protein
MAWLLAHLSEFSAVGAVVVFFWGIWTYLDQRRRESDQRGRESSERQFEMYHRLVKELVSPDDKTQATWIDRQGAVVFELRHFPRSRKEC